MRSAAVLLVTIACSGAFASEPNTPLDCSDWVFLEPGYSCSERKDCGAEPCYIGDDLVGIDVASELLWFRRFASGMCGVAVLQRTEVVRDSAVETVIAYINDRCVTPSGVHGEVHDAVIPYGGVQFDPSRGQLLMSVRSQGGDPYYPVRSTMIAISGFATTFDVLQTYTPEPALGFRVPYMPEGMAGADHFDTYWGILAHPIDFTQAHPLQCGYPAAPHLGDYLTVADTVPTPPPGEGVYYVTSSTYQGTTRYGRKTTAGHMSGRDPAELPACLGPVAQVQPKGYSND